MLSKDGGSDWDKSNAINVVSMFSESSSNYPDIGEWLHHNLNTVEEKNKRRNKDEEDKTGTGYPLTLITDNQADDG